MGNPELSVSKYCTQHVCWKINKKKKEYLSGHISYMYLQRCKEWHFRGGFRGGSWGSVESPFDSKFHFHRKFWINLINLGPFCFILLFNKSILLLVNVYKTAGWVAKHCRPWLDAAFWCLIWFYTVCSGLSVRIRRVSMVIWLNRTLLRNPESAPAFFHYMI